ncbi:VOC family protein [Microbacterium protaetiae]|uniref:VOC family protein n=1 Tax=Microbacterium protaetiae TaxID=2509458 RepID=UPI0013EBEE42|nr:VOC family protein [Microbacterium protaetiae]
MNVKTALHRIVISVRSTQAAVGFYRDLLGLTTEAGPQMTRLSDRTIEILLHERSSRPSDLSVALSFRVADLDETCSTWERSGGTVVDPPEQQPWGEWTAVVREPDGHLVCLTQ